MEAKEHSVLTHLGAGLTGILSPVSICMGITCILVKLLNPDGNSGSNALRFASIAYDEDSSDSNTQKFEGAFLNALIYVLIITAMTFVMVLLFKYGCTRILWLWVGLGVFDIFFAVTGLIGIEVLQALNIHVDIYSFFFMLTNFAVVGTLGVLFIPIPLLLKQGYLVWVGIIVAYIFTWIPEWTAWMIICAMALYDIAAVLLPGGPLKLLLDEAIKQEEALPGLLYEARPSRGPYQGPNTWARQRGTPAAPGATVTAADHATGAPPAAGVHASASFAHLPHSTHSSTHGQEALGAEASSSHMPLPAVPFPPLLSPQQQQQQQQQREQAHSGQRSSAQNKLHPLESPVSSSPSDSCPEPVANNSDVPTGHLSAGHAEGEGGGVAHDHAANNPTSTHTDSMQHVSAGPSAANNTVLDTQAGPASAGVAHQHPASSSSSRQVLCAQSVRGDEGSGAGSSSQGVRQQRGLTQVGSQAGERGAHVALAVTAGPTDGAGDGAGPGTTTRPEARKTRAGMSILSQSTQQPQQQQQQQEQGGVVQGSVGGAGHSDDELQHAGEGTTMLPVQNMQQFGQQNGQQHGHEGGGGGHGLRGGRAGHGSEAGSEEGGIEDLDAIKLGLGDFVFYSLLVGRAAMYDYMTLFAAYIGIIAGLGLTLIFLALSPHALPALPFSIAMGVVFYFFTRIVLEPYVVPLAMHLQFY